MVGVNEIIGFVIYLDTLIDFDILVPVILINDYRPLCMQRFTID